MKSKVNEGRVRECLESTVERKREEGDLVSLFMSDSRDRSKVEVVERLQLMMIWEL